VLVLTRDTTIKLLIDSDCRSDQIRHLRRDV